MRPDAGCLIAGVTGTQTDIEILTVSQLLESVGAAE